MLAVPDGVGLQVGLQVGLVLRWLWVVSMQRWVMEPPLAGRAVPWGSGPHAGWASSRPMPSCPLQIGWASVHGMMPACPMQMGGEKGTLEVAALRDPEVLGIPTSPQGAQECMAQLCP